jgi:hypothetical protein
MILGPHLGPILGTPEQKDGCLPIGNGVQQLNWIYYQLNNV